MQRQSCAVPLPDRADIRQLNDSLGADAFPSSRHWRDRLRREHDDAGFILAQNLVPVQWDHLGLVDTRARIQLSFPNYLPRQLFDFNAVITFLRWPLLR